MLNELHGSKVFSTIGLRSGHHQIRMKEGDDWKTTSKTNYGLYKWLIIPFGLSNTPSIFMCLMNEVLRLFIRKLVVLYFDDILVYNLDEASHAKHLTQVFQVLRQQALYVYMVNMRSSSSLLLKLFRSYVVSGDGIQVDESKIKAIKNWLIPTIITEVHSFHEFSSFYHRFIKDFSSIMAHLTSCMKKGSFEWTKVTQRAFESIKETL